MRKIYPQQKRADLIPPKFLRMWMAVVLCIAMASQVVYAQSLNFNFNRKVSIAELISSVKTQTGYIFYYNGNEFDDNRLVDVPRRTISFEQTMEIILEKGFSYTKEGSDIVITKNAASARPQSPRNVVLQGTVKNTEGEPCIGVTVIVKGTDRGTTTDASGRFRMNVPESANMTVVFSFIGMETQEVVYSGQTDFNIVMKASSTKIDDVVVTGIFEFKKEGYTGSATTLNSEDIKALTSDNVLSALAIADPSFKMDVSNVMGSNPTAIPEFQMRGQATIDDSYTSVDDAYVLRGDYNSRPNQPLFVLDGIIDVKATTIMDLDPDQVASITMLKDAAATAIYGSQAANGVVVIETKKPERGKLRITYNGTFGVSMPDLSDYNLANAREKLTIEELAGYYSRNNNLSVLQYYADLKLNVLRGVDTDWLAQPVQNAFTHKHGVNLEGGDDNLRYKVYLGANFAPGVMKNTFMNTQSAQVDLHYRTGKLLIVNQTYLNAGKGERESNYGSFRSYALMNPYFSPYDESGNLKKILDPNNLELGGYDTPALNPMYNTLFDSRNEVRDFEMKESLKVQYTASQYLKLEMNFTMTKNTGTTEVFKSASHTESEFTLKPTDKGRYVYINTEENSYNVSFSAMYNRLFRDAHLLSLNARYDVKENKSYMSSITMSGFPNDKLSEIFMGTTFKSIAGDESVNRQLGLVMSADYSYKERYNAHLSARVDASTQFGRDNRYAPFWSAGLRWNGHNESFIRKLDFFDALVLRASYGITGSQSFSSYQALQMYTYSNLMSEYVSSDVVGAELYGMGNPDLKWQQTDNYNTALEFGILNNIISGRVEYYYKYTKNTLLDYTLAPSIGFASVKDNLGNISNQGVEASLRITPYRDESKGAYWNVTFNAVRNKSKIEKISNSLAARNEEVYGTEADNDLTRPMPQYVNGRSNTAIWAMKSLGIDPQSGNEILLTRDGQQTYVWSAKDMVIVGDREPKLAGSIATSFGYRNLTVTVAAQYTLGGDIYNTTLADKVENANLRLNVDKRVLNDRWVNYGDEAQFKALNSWAERTMTNATSRFVMRRNEIQVTSINVGYRMARTDFKFLAKAGLSSATFNLYFADALRFSTIKMERGTSYPFAHQIRMSLNLVF